MMVLRRQDSSDKLFSASSRANSAGHMGASTNLAASHCPLPASPQLRELSARQLTLHVSLALVCDRHGVLVFSELALVESDVAVCNDTYSVPHNGELVLFPRFPIEGVA